MEKQFELSFKRTLIALVIVGVLTTAVALAGRGFLLPGPGDTHGHMHGTPGPFFENFLKEYVPRRQCMFLEPGVIWLHFISDFLIALAYFSIPIALVYFVRRRKDLAFTWIFWMFASFILLCGTTHIIGMFNLWQALYKVDGVVKLITGIVSIFTAIALWPLIPKALALPSPALLEERVKERTAELAKANSDRQILLERERLLRNEAEKTNLLKDEFLATLSHELRTPLNAILGWAQVLKKKSPEASIAEGLDVIERNSRLQAMLVGDLLDMSSIISGKLKLDTKEFNFNELVEEAIESIRPAADAKKINIKNASPSQPYPFWGDPARLQQVLWNLLSNAVKFTPSGGEIEVQVKYTEEAIETTVKDSGIGIKPKFIPYLFDRFSQADSSTTRAFGGLGLGLAISKHLVEMHGGTLHGYSEGEGKGSAFTFILPRTLASKFGNIVKPDSVGSNHFKDFLATRKVLIVDDEVDSLELMKVILEEAGAKVYTASNAEEARELINSEKPDLLLCDISMPDEDGYTFLRKLRESSDNVIVNIPAIAVSALANTEAKTKSIAAGFAKHIAKPIEHNDLIAVAAQVLKPNRQV